MLGIKQGGDGRLCGSVAAGSLSTTDVFPFECGHPANPAPCRINSRCYANANKNEVV